MCNAGGVGVELRIRPVADSGRVAAKTFKNLDEQFQERRQVGILRCIPLLMAPGNCIEPILQLAR